MKELPERKTVLRLKSDPKKQNSFKKLVWNNNWKKKEDYKNKQKLKKLNLSLQFVSKEN